MRKDIELKLEQAYQSHRDEKDAVAFEHLWTAVSWMAEDLEKLQRKLDERKP